ncbi:hypothetical protein KCK34_001614 [Clostridium perfringens]|uniref:hypothetical protein n=1 Tax=Clostridium perfringens TaxID=1502 RepID=UPI001D4C61AE|nr:hypothetical protein [Clostridium perfringens]EHK2335175.1 hypothetical protein [Clostridium perfringens]
MSSNIDLAMKIAVDILTQGMLGGSIIRDTVNKLVESPQEDKDKFSDKDYANIKEQIALMQELAISKRIETADVVEIEEYYSNEKDGCIGAKAQETGVTLGISASGKNLIKRVYKFQGYNDKRIECYEETRNSIISKVCSEQEKDK